MAATFSEENASDELTASFKSCFENSLVVYCLPCDQKRHKLAFANCFCTVCDGHMCRNCFNSHTHHSPSKNDTFSDDTNLRNTLLQGSATVNFVTTDDLTEPCLKHKDETIEFYCQDHKELLCNVCVTLGHRPTSCKFDYISDISERVIDSQEYQETLKHIHTISNNFLEMKEHTTNTISKSDESLSGVLDDIKKFRKEINERLDELEQQAEDAALRILQENRKNLNKVDTACSDVTIFLRNAANAIRQLNTSKHSDKLFVELKRAEEMVKQYEIKFEEFTNFDIKEFNFKPNEAISSLLSVKETNLGTFSPIPLQMKSRLICNQSEICAQTLREKQMCSITGMTLVSPELLAIADNRNMTLKLVDVCNQRLTALLNLYNEPWDVTTISNDEVAVTLPSKQTIQFLSVSSNKLIKKHAIQTDGECYGISCNQGKMVVSFNDPTKLQIIDIDDNTVLTTVGAGLTFIKPLYVIANEISIYVTDGEMRKLLRLNWQGDAISSYGDMKNASKIAFSDSGTVFVCDLQRNVIEEVLEDCSRGKVVLRNVNSPRAICWCPETNRMYMSCGTDDGRYDNVIHIYKML